MAPRAWGLRDVTGGHDPWAAANASLLAARGLEALPPAEATTLLGLLHAGTLVELPDARATGRFDLERLRLARALDAGALDEAEAEAAALRLLTLGHREPARVRLEASSRLRAAWRAWTGEGPAEEGADAAELRVGGLAIVPAAPSGEVVIRVAADAERRVALRRLRIGPTVLDVALSRRAGSTVVRLARRHGPALVAQVEVAGAAALVADEVPLEAPRARLELREAHEVVAYG